MPKGLIEDGETPALAARREAEEELGIALVGEPKPLCRLRQAGGKLVDVFALEQDIDPAAVASNHFELEWPPRSGRMQSFPEIEEAAWFTLAEARRMILASQTPMIDAIQMQVSEPGKGAC